MAAITPARAMERPTRLGQSKITDVTLWSWVAAKTAVNIRGAAITALHKRQATVPPSLEIKWFTVNEASPELFVWHQ